MNWPFARRNRCALELEADICGLMREAECLVRNGQVYEGNLHQWLEAASQYLAQLPARMHEWDGHRNALEHIHSWTLRQGLHLDMHEASNRIAVREGEPLSLESSL